MLKTLTCGLVALMPIAAGVACRTAAAGPGPQIVQPGAPGEPSHVIAPDKAVDLSKVQFTTADVKFMQGMIGHHEQAIEMTDLLATRTASENMRKLAQRIDLSQADEIKMMRRWLETR